MSLVAMAIFFHTEMTKHDAAVGDIYIGAILFRSGMLMFNGTSDLSMMIYKLLIYYKQRNMSFFLRGSYALPSCSLKILLTFIEVAIWTFLTYYVIGSDPDVGRLFKHYLLLLVVKYSASALFRYT